MNILGIRLDNLSREEILKKVESFLLEEKFHQIATVNPEFILAAQKDLEFKNILNDCDLNISDGAGINFAFWSRGVSLKCRLAGADLMEEILNIAEKNGLKIFLIANSGGLSTWEETRDAIQKKYPGLEISGANIGNWKLEIGNLENYEVIFANLGAPNQEKFINSLKSAENGSIRLAMGVGGSFDYLTGKICRAPKFMRQIGLEWLWRLVQQPKRLARIWNAVIVFPWKIISNK